MLFTKPASLLAALTPQMAQMERPKEKEPFSFTRELLSCPRRSSTVSLVRRVFSIMARWYFLPYGKMGKIKRILGHIYATTSLTIVQCGCSSHSRSKHYIWTSGFDLTDVVKYGADSLLKSTGGHFSKVCSIAVSNPWVAIILWFIVSLTKKAERVEFPKIASCSINNCWAGRKSRRRHHES